MAGVHGDSVLQPSDPPVDSRVLLESVPHRSRTALEHVQARQLIEGPDHGFDADLLTGVVVGPLLERHTDPGLHQEQPEEDQYGQEDEAGPHSTGKCEGALEQDDQPEPRSRLDQEMVLAAVADLVGDDGVQFVIAEVVEEVVGDQHVAEAWKRTGDHGVGHPSGPRSYAAHVAHP